MIFLPEEAGTQFSGVLPGSLNLSFTGGTGGLDCFPPQKLIYCRGCIQTP